MKIAVYLAQITCIGGVGIAVVNEVRELRKMGVDASLVIAFRRKEYNAKELFEAYDIPIIFLSDKLPKFLRFSFKIPGFSFFSFLHLSSILWAPILIKKYNFDVIVAHETYNCFSAIACAKKTKAELISFIWDPVSYIVPRVYGDRKFLKPFSPLISFISQLIDKYILNNSRAIITCSSLHEGILRKLNKEVLIFKVFPGNEIAKTLLEKKGKNIVSLTKWDIGKNPEFLLKVAKRIKGDFCWKIAGNWVEENLFNEFKEKIKRYGLEEKILIVGKIFGNKKNELLLESRVLVHPIVEAFGMFALEAAGCGCPVIIPKKSGACELFIENIHGFFPDEGDVGEFAGKLNLLLNNEDKALEMGKSAWLVAKNYTWKKHSQRLLDIIKKEIK